MKISVITPSFNQGIFIEDAIESVLQQDFKNFEHIVIDGGSTDGTLNCLKKYPHLIWVSEKDEGQSDALIKGFKKASGDVICWLNADDYYLKGTFFKINNYLTRENIDGVYSDILFCDKNRNIIGRKRSHKSIKFFSVFHCYIPSESLFIKRKIVDKNILIDKHFHITMDKEFIAHILYSNYRLKYINDIFSVFRRHESNKSNNSSDVKMISSQEGLLILNRYWKINIPINKLTIRVYRITCLILLPIRKVIFERILKVF